MPDTEETPKDARQVDLVNFLEEYVNPTLSAGYRSTLASLVANYGRAEYGRGYDQGAKDSW